MDDGQYPLHQPKSELDSPTVLWTLRSWAKAIIQSAQKEHIKQAERFEWTEMTHNTAPRALRVVDL